MQRLLLKFTLLLLALAPAHAQLEVGLELDRRMFLRGEAIEAKVTIKNLTGHTVEMADTDTARWFGFEVLHGVDSPIGPFDSNYKNPPQTILAGDVVERTVNLLKLYPINELGAYKVRATVYFPELQKYLVSRAVIIDISNGKTLWRQTVGVPNGKEGAGQYRDVSLIMFQKPRQMELYARVEDLTTADVLATYPLGRILGGATPMTEFSDDNTLYSFHMTGPSQYALSKVGINGEWLGQSLWISPSGRATVRKKPDGKMVVVGASRNREPAPGGPPTPKLSDRPVALPAPK
jgi:hypothetical protein